jgi:hypothetical protein
MLSMKLDGVENLDKLLRQMSDGNAAKNIMRMSLREGSKLIEDATKSNAHSMVGGTMGARIASKITTRAAKKQKKSEYRLNTIIKGDRKEFLHTTKQGKEYYIPAAIEYGHTTRGGKKQVAPIPFMRKAFDEKAKQAVKIVVDKAWVLIKKTFTAGTKRGVS